ncbi:putative clathrin assembly protein At1g03050 [Aristolochia californica]|uniref:putative clathrin assembly protein At1g03050 n=1 Tax=Aristolochia californica TaxID=171875 RepID=UPI0035DE56F9
MGSSKIRKALGAVKDKTSIGLAKVGSSNSLSDLDVAIVKATRHEEQPAEERHIREILSLTCYSRAYVSACVNSLSRRLNKTRNWTVALKTLILIHRLLTEGDPAYEQEIFFSTRRGTRLLNMSDFCDTSRSNAWDFSAFVRTFALYLDERLEFRMQGKKGRRNVLAEAEEEEQEATPGTGVSLRSTPVRDMKTERIFIRVQQLLQLLERFLACRPTGAAKHNRVVIVALYPLVKESFQLYYDIAEVIGILIDRFMEMEVSDCVKVYEIFSRIGKQFDELDIFYQWSKKVGIARSSEYPDVEKITQKKLDIMDEFIRDKSALANSRRLKSQEQMREAIQEANEEEPSEDMNSIKALPAPESSQEILIQEVTEEKEPEKEENKQICTQVEADLLYLYDGALTCEEKGDEFALALFAGEAAAPTWEAFKDESSSGDWETALVQSASNLSNQKSSLGGGFNMLMLDGMYQQPAVATGNHAAPSGSASSMAYPVKTQGFLALPAPPVPGSQNGGDPFAASNTISPPAYVQMSDMEKKQKLLVEEQFMWQQYAREGMQGHLPVAQMHPNYHMGAYAQGYYR